MLAALEALAPRGLEERDAGPQNVEYVFYGSAAELPSSTALAAAAGDAFTAVNDSEIADDWDLRWREFHRPLVLGQRLCVRPPWEPPQGTELEIVIDPGPAFGTGAHATTRLCLELLLDLDLAANPDPAPAAAVSRASDAPAVPLDSGPLRDPYGQPHHHRCLDLGCGSGVLAITAAMLGAGSVLGLDHDQAALDATLANARANHVADQIHVKRFDLCREPVPETPLVLANLLAPLLERWCEQLAAGRARVPRRAIVSGLLEREADRVAARFASVGLRERRRGQCEQWVALELERGFAEG